MTTSLNVEALTKLADRLEGRTFPSNVAFTMNYFDSRGVIGDDTAEKDYYLAKDADIGTIADCGTAACLAGLTKIMFPEANIDGFRDAASFLGVNDEKFFDEEGDNMLFFPRHVTRWQDITPEGAAKVVRNIIDGGDVDWTLAGVKVEEERVSE